MNPWPLQQRQAQTLLSGSSLGRLRIVVLGYIVRGPIGGMAWHHLQYVLGLVQLGHDVLFLEDSDDYPSCYDPITHQVGTDPSYGLQFAERAFARLGLAERWGYYDAHCRNWHGPVTKNAVQLCQSADLLINVSGVNPLRPWLRHVPIRALVDTDPAFTQVRHLNDAKARNRALEHNAFFSFGESIESGASAVPDDGIRWQATRQPIVLDIWPQGEPPASGAFTTVMQWSSYSPVEYDGMRLGMKSESFAIIQDLPRRVQYPVELALGGTTAPRDALGDLGWRVVDPLAVTRDPWTYQQYLQNSRGELSAAKHGYVASRSGWFSERTACYLATGRPAIVQDTGFGCHIPSGAGVWAFHDTESAIDALERVACNYKANCRAAREIAGEYFDSRKVLESLVERAFLMAHLPASSVGNEA